MDAQEQKPMGINSLLFEIERFITDNRFSQLHLNRWLANDYLATIPALLRQARSDDLDTDWQKKIIAFRLRELDAQKVEKRKEIDQLEAETRRLTQENNRAA